MAELTEAAVAVPEVTDEPEEATLEAAAVAEGVTERVLLAVATMMLEDGAPTETSEVV